MGRGTALSLRRERGEQRRTGEGGTDMKADLCLTITGEEKAERKKEMTQREEGSK